MGHSMQIEDVETPLNVPLCAKYMRSFAYPTMKDRVPIILTKVIDGLVRDKENIILCYGEKAREELKKVIGSISQLKNELQTDKPLTLLSSRGPDADLWNNHLKNSSSISVPSYFQTDWMYAECYVYRRLREAFLISDSLQYFDPFHWQKKDALENSLTAFSPLAVHINTIVTSDDISQEDLKLEFIRLLKNQLWGNKCDLSLSTGGQVKIEENPLKTVEKLNSFILADQSEDVWNALPNCRGHTVDIILDNSGYELVTDLCLAEFLIRKFDVAKIRFRAKVMPWYVSDVMEKDFHYVINSLSEMQSPFSDIANRWLEYVNSGKFELIADKFWTLPYSYNCMFDIDDKLYKDLATSKLLIFKGDLNYRKLVGDINWPKTYSFKCALRGFYPAPFVTLRTLKADVVCGLEPGKAEEAEKKSANWQVTGDFAVIQFYGEEMCK